MEIEILVALKKYWGKNGIVSVNTESDISSVLAAKNLTLPHDFIFFFKHLNGMHDQDEEGFYFYKIEDLTDMRRKFDLSASAALSRIVIFADYMVESWWYGVRTGNNGQYEIGIISSSEDFKIICISFSEFIHLYLMDSPILYKYD